jgi:hypothetical protein
MALPVLDPGIAAMAATMPCYVRRKIILTGDSTKLPDYGMFPKDGQYIDTPRGVAAKWTSDMDVHLPA